jgi:hypothetical protein
MKRLLLSERLRQRARLCFPFAKRLERDGLRKMRSWGFPCLGMGHGWFPHLTQLRNWNTFSRQQDKTVSTLNFREFR